MAQGNSAHPLSADDSEEIADRVQAEFHETFDSLSKQPGQGHRRTDYTQADVLFFPIYSYLIAYRARTDPLQVLAIVHGARDVQKVLKRRRVK